MAKYDLKLKFGIDNTSFDKEAKKFQQKLEKDFKIDLGLNTKNSKELNKIEDTVTKIKKVTKDPIKLSTSVNADEFGKLYKDYLDLSRKVTNSKLNLGIKVKDPSQIPTLEKQVEALRKETNTPIAVRFNVQQASSVLNQIDNKLDLIKRQSTLTGLKTGGGNFGAGVLDGATGQLGLGGLSGGLAVGAGALAGGAVMGFAVSEAKKGREVFIKFDDALADVSKTSGISGVELQQLKRDIFELGKTTRTSNQDLFKTAQGIGRLGLVDGFIEKGDLKGAREEMLKLVKSINIFGVALGDEYSGGIEEAIQQVGNIARVFQDFKDVPMDEAFLKVGNAVNSLASKTAASAPVITDFANRIGGRLGAGNVLGISATLETLGVTAERGGTAVRGLVQKMSTPDGLKGFAQAIGMNANEFKKMVDTNPNEALLIFTQRLVEGSKTTTEMAEKLDTLGLTGAGVSEAVQKLGENTETVRGNQALANEELTNANGIQSEYETKNENAAAAVEKHKNEVEALRAELGEGLNPAFEAIEKGFLRTVIMLVEQLTKDLEFAKNAWNDLKNSVDNRWFAEATNGLKEGQKAKGKDGKSYGAVATGGFVRGGSNLQVNEQGKELFVPNQDGTILPAQMTNKILQNQDAQRQMMATQITNNFNMNSSGSEKIDASYSAYLLSSQFDTILRNRI